MSTPNVLFISHGGGPRPLLGAADHAEMVDVLKEFAKEIPKPSAILLISAHWESERPQITSGKSPMLIYDYYGFPPESYEIQYPAPGYPELAQQVNAALNNAEIESDLDDQRGFDHGMFVPLKVMYPDADIPVVQLSLVSSLDPEIHIQIGKALISLDIDDLLVIGSGFSFHNMRAFYAPDTAELREKNLGFEHWLHETLTNENLSKTEIEARLIDWEEAPFARFCHPREEHLLPLHVCYGLTERPSTSYKSATILGKHAGMFYWGTNA